MLTSDQKGSIAEMEIATAAIKLGIGVFKPLSDGHRFDLIFALPRTLLRVQCKSAWRKGDVLVVNCRSCRRSAEGYVRRTYTSEEVDVLAAYSLELDRSFLVPMHQVPDAGSMYLRIAPVLNGQRASINWADEFAFEATLGDAGAIAQLEERLLGMQEVAGSSPAGSTSFSATVGAHEFRNHFGWYMERAAAGEEIAVTRRGKPYVRLVAAQ